MRGPINRVTELWILSALFAAIHPITGGGDRSPPKERPAETINGKRCKRIYVNSSFSFWPPMELFRDTIRGPRPDGIRKSPADRLLPPPPYTCRGRARKLKLLRWAFKFGAHINGKAGRFTTDICVSYDFIFPIAANWNVICVGSEAYVVDVQSSHLLLRNDGLHRIFHGLPIG